VSRDIPSVGETITKIFEDWARENGYTKLPQTVFVFTACSGCCGALGEGVTVIAVTDSNPTNSQQWELLREYLRESLVIEGDYPLTDEQLQPYLDGYSEDDFLISERPVAWMKG